ncbi:MAG TPA: fatty acid desaturase [Pseudobdellovibrionaceae bacterium]|nr:fatty acid desaturase [Pseudobdellovibrionaceae bacterium]
MKHRPPEFKLLGHPAERRTLGLLTLGLIGVLLPYALLPGPTAWSSDWSSAWSLGWSIALLGLQVIGSYIGNGINHNHSHRPTLATRAQNRVFNGALSLVVGYPVSVLKIIHGLNHHGEFGTNRDWSGTHQLDQKSFGGLLRYTLRAFRSMNQPEAKARELSLRPALQSEIRRESRVLLLIVAILLLASPLTFLTITLPAWVISNFAAVMINAIQHGGCDLQSSTNHSVNFTGRFYNFWLCNNGYHTWHHDHTDAHWSDLPARHREHLDAHMPTELNQANFLSYLFREYGPRGSRPIRDLSTSPPPKAWPVPTEFDPTHPNSSAQAHLIHASNHLGSSPPTQPPP